MVLYVLKYRKKIIAISEYKKDMKLFILQNNFTSDNGYGLYKEKDQKSINKLLIVYDENYLTEYENYILRYKDIPVIEDLIYREYSELERTLEHLIHISKNYNISSKEVKTINKTISILNKDSYDEINKMIDVGAIISDYVGSPSLQNLFEGLTYYL